MLVTINAKQLHESTKKWKEMATNSLLGYSPAGEHPNS